LKEAALDRTVWRPGFGRGCGLVVRQTTERRLSRIDTSKSNLILEDNIKMLFRVKKVKGKAIPLQSLYKP
jgi:hypothetical protein